jgi:hypothetical protein
MVLGEVFANSVNISRHLAAIQLQICSKYHVRRNMNRRDRYLQNSDRKSDALIIPQDGHAAFAGDDA